MNYGNYENWFILINDKPLIKSEWSCITTFWQLIFIHRLNNIYYTIPAMDSI